ncbi:MAG: HIT family protein [Planctomycetota bacterium]
MARSLRNLHAPWRIDFILGPKAKGCFLCTAARLPEPLAGVGSVRGVQGAARAPGAKAGQRWKQWLLLARTDLCTVVMNRYPYTGGHLLISPRRHSSDFSALPSAVTAEMMRLASISTGVLDEVMHPHGFNLGMNLGTAAGAGIKDHLHLHVIPRWTGDTNFLPLVADVTQVPVAIDALYDQLKPVFDRAVKK